MVAAVHNARVTGRVRWCNNTKKLFREQKNQAYNSERTVDLFRYTLYVLVKARVHRTRTVNLFVQNLLAVTDAGKHATFPPFLVHTPAS